MLVVYLAPLAQSEPVESGQAIGAGWAITDITGTIDPLTLTPTAVADVPASCPAAPAPCEDHEANDLLGGASLSTFATATALTSEAHAFKDPAASTHPDRFAALQTIMQNQSGVPLPTGWNVHGYASVAGFSALGGQITADLIEAETVGGMRLVGGTPTSVVASGASIVNLVVRDPITNAPIPIPVPNQPNQLLVNTPTLQIEYWDTNWNPTSGTTTDGQPVYVNTLRISSTLPPFNIVVGRAVATNTFVTPAPPAANQPPNAVNDSANTTQGTPVDIDVTNNDTDTDGTVDDTTVTITDQPDNGTVTCVDNICTYTPNAGFSGNDSFTYRVCDDDGDCDTAIVSVTVAAAPPAPPAPEAPVANDDTANTTESTPVTIDVDSNDSDADGNLDPSTVSITVPPAAGAGSVICNNSGVCTYTPAPGFSGTATFTYRICDTTGLCDTATVTVTVAGVPAGLPPLAPTAVDDLAATDDLTQIVIPVLVNDVPGDAALDNTTLTVQVHPNPAHGSVICSAGQCTFTPQQGFAGTATFVYQICDVASLCDTATVTITVVAAPGGGPVGGNNPPTAVDDSASTPRNTGVTIDVIANDSDPDVGDAPVPSSVAVTIQPTNGAVVCSNGSCTYTPNTGFVGNDSFTYRVCDSSSACDTAVVTISVTAPGPANNPPVAADDVATTGAGNPTVIPVAANDTDPDGDLVPSSAAVTVFPANGAVVCSNGSCTYIPNPGFTGNDSFTYRICDTNNACDSAVVSITVSPAPAPPPAANQPPVAENDTRTSDGGPVTIPVMNNDSDSDGTLSPASVFVTQHPANGAVICSGGACTYTPNPGFTGTDSFEYRVCDDDGACDTAVVTVTVTAGSPPSGANLPPVAEDDAVATELGEPVEIVVVDNDSDPEGDLDPGTVIVVRPPAHGAVICIGGVCTYTPEPGYTGEDTFDYRVCDVLGACTTGTVTIEIPGAAPSPTSPPSDPGGSIGEGGSSGGGGNGNGRPGRDGQPSRPGDGNDAGIDPVPLTGLDPILGAPRNPAMPMTGGEPGFYLALALNLVLVGGLLLFLDTRSRRTVPVAFPELLGGESDRSEPQAEVVLQSAEQLPNSVSDGSEPKKPAARKPAAVKKPAAKKSATTKASTAKKKTTAKRAASTKKSTVAKPAAKKASTSKKTTVRATSSKKSTVAKKSTVRKTTVRKSAAAS